MKYLLIITTLLVVGCADIHEPHEPEPSCAWMTCRWLRSRTRSSSMASWVAGDRPLHLIAVRQRSISHLYPM